jgi:hypothetical protein
VLPTIDSAILQRVDAFKDDATVRNFDDAERALKLIIEIKNNLPGTPISLDINALNKHLERCRKVQGDEEATTKAVADLRAEVERQKEEAKRQKEEAERQRKEAERKNKQAKENLQIFQAIGTIAGMVTGGSTGAMVGNAVGAVIDTIAVQEGGDAVILRFVRGDVRKMACREVLNRINR